MKVTAIALLTLSGSLTTIPTILAAENSDECHMIMPSGEKIDLSELCTSPFSRDSQPNISNNNNPFARIIYGEQETLPIPENPKLNFQVGKRGRQREIESKKVFQEYSQYQQYLKYYRENSGN